MAHRQQRAELGVRRDARPRVAIGTFKNLDVSASAHTQVGNVDGVVLGLRDQLDVVAAAPGSVTVDYGS